MTTSPPLINNHVHPTDGQIICLNCNHPYSGQYCNQCGQQADTHPINWRYLWHEISETILGIDRGIFFTLRELFTRPGYSIHEFLAGRRVNHYRPLALLLLLGAIFVFVSQVLHVDFLKASQDTYGNLQFKANSSSMPKEVLTKYFQFLDENQQFSDLAMIPFVAFWFWRLFRRWGYNYPEQLIAQTFIANFNLFLTLFLMLVFWASGDSANVLSGIMGISALIPVAYNAFAYTQLFKGRLKPLSIVLRSISAYLLGYLSLIFVCGIAVGVYAIVFTINTYQQEALPKKATPATSQHVRH